MTISYNNNIPAGPDNPSSDRPLMTTNTNATSQFLAVDHDPFSIAGVSSPTVASGYHTVIHQVTQGSDPAGISGVNQLYAKLGIAGFGTSNQLWYRSGTGHPIQLTGSNETSNGWVFCAGMIFQWGTSSGTGSVTFSPAFPNNCFNIQVTSSAGTGSILIPTLSRTGFTYSPLASSIYWFAIGN